MTEALNPLLYFSIGFLVGVIGGLVVRYLFGIDGE